MSNVPSAIREQRQFVLAKAFVAVFIQQRFSADADEAGEAIKARICVAGATRGEQCRCDKRSTAGPIVEPRWSLSYPMARAAAFFNISALRRSADRSSSDISGSRI